MPDRRDALVVVVPTADSVVAPAVARAYEHLVAMDLIEPCVWVTASRDGTPFAIVLDHDHGDPAVVSDSEASKSLLEIVAGSEATRIRVLSLVLPGEERLAGSDDWAGRIEEAFSVFEGANMDISYVSALVPTLDSPPGEVAAPSIDAAFVRTAPWINVLVAPEDRQDDEAMAVPIRCGVSFPYHAASAVATLAATWMGMDDDPLDEWRRESSEALMRPAGAQVVVARSRSRSMVAPSTADTVPGAVFARRETWPARAGTVQARVPTSVIDTVGKHFIKGEGRPLAYLAPAPPSLPGPQALSIGALFRLVRDWLTRSLPSIVAADIRARVVGAADGIEDWVSNRVLGTNSIYRLDRRGRLAVESEQLEADAFVRQIETDFGSELVNRTPPAEPQVWRSLRSVAFAVIDGGPLPADLSSQLSDGGKRTVLTNPLDVAPDPESSGWWEPSPAVSALLGFDDLSLRICDVWTSRRCGEALQALAAERAAQGASTAALPPPPAPLPPPPVPAVPMGPASFAPASPPPPPAAMAAPTADAADVASAERQQALRDLDPSDIAADSAALETATVRQSGSFLWRVAQTTADAMDQAMEDFRHLVEVIADPPGEALAARLKKEARSARRRLFWRLVFALVLLWVGLQVVPTLPLEGTAARVVTVAVFVIVAALVLAGVWRYVGDRFRRDHELATAIGEYQHACDSIAPVLIEVSRLHHVYQQLLDWSEILAVMVHRPFGGPVAMRGRMHGTWSGDLQAHQIGEGDISPDTLTGLVSGQQERVYGAGWISSIYEKVHNEVLGRYRNLTQQSPDAADPDADNSTTRFIDPVRDHAPRQFLRNELDHGEPLRDLRVSEMDEVLSRLAELPPGKLCDVVNGQPPTDWLVDAVPRLNPARFPRTIWSEEGMMNLSQDIVARRAVWMPSGLGASCPTGVAVHAASPNVSVLAASVVCVDLSNPVEPAHIALLGDKPTAPVERIPVPLAPSARVEREWVSFGGVGPDESLLPAAGAEISPSARPTRPKLRGSYAFMSIVDGRPCRFPLDQAIPFRVRSGIGPQDAYQMVTTSIQAIANATGHHFSFDGNFEKLTDIDLEAGGIWIAFAEPNERGADGTVILGHGGVMTDGERIVGGQAIVGNDAGAEPGFGPGHTLGSVLLHELCHAMNLSHVEVQSELMFPFATTLTPPLFGPGDEMGLWLLGVGRGAQT